MTRRGELIAEVMAAFDDYMAAFQSGTREQVQAFTHLPVAYIGENDVQLRERYPFDPVKLREATGFHHADLEVDIVHIDEQKAHMLLDGTRHRVDCSVIERIQSIYIFQKRNGVWKVAAFSGIRTPA